MKFRYCRMAAACALALAGAPVLAQEADAGIDFKFSGFGTLAASHTGYDLGDITGDVFQTSGAGRSRSTSFGLDTKLGLQLSAQFNPQWSAVVQVISKHQEDSTYTVSVQPSHIAPPPA